MFAKVLDSVKLILSGVVDHPRIPSSNLRELVTSTTVICNTRTRVEGRSELQLDPPFPDNPRNPRNPDENSQMLILMHRH